MASSESGTLPDPPLVTRNNLQQHRPSISRSSEDGSDYCRICRGEATAEQPLFYPCKCSGSIKYVHQDCLMEWLSHSQKKYCELCKTPFRFTKLYDRSMPATLPTPLFVRQLAYHTLQGFIRWARYILVGFIWVCCLPWCIRQVWRGLFWLADGSWLSEEELRRAVLRHMNMTESETTVLQSHNSPSIAATIDSAAYAPHHNVAPLVSFLTAALRFLSGETLLAKILRFLFSVPPVQFGTTTQAKSFNLTKAGNSQTRPPSLLSEFSAVNSLTSSSFFNNALIDILEGQLICIHLIAAFILVFLIREWVINQQPVLNMPDPDPVENVAPLGQLDNLGRPVGPRRRRGGVLRPRGGQNVLQAQLNPGIAARPVVAPQPRRALTDDNIAVPARTEQQRPDLLIRSASLAPQLPFDSSNQNNDFADRVLNNSLETEESISPPLMRGALGHAVDIHRALEEAGGASDHVAESSLLPSLEPQSTLAHQTDLDGAQSSATSFDGTAVRVDPDDGDEKTKLSHDAVTGISAKNDLPLLDAVVEMDENISLLPETDMDTMNADWHNLEHEVEADTPDPVDTPNVVDEAVQMPTRIERVAAWFWHTENFTPEPSDIQPVDAQVIETNNAEAPFVPIANHEAVPAQPQIPAVPVREPNIQFGIDLNDPNALDEAEDLDGILELIGMEGPLAGMIQNVIFSLFLITLILTASIWIPYIWGKIALLFLANPLIVFVRAPLYIMSSGADTIADLVFFVVGLSSYLINHGFKLAKLVMAHLLPVTSDFLNTELIEKFSLNLTRSSGHRLEKAIGGTFINFRPDLPTFSMQSHHALVVFKSYISRLMHNLVNLGPKSQISFRTESWSLPVLQQHTAGFVKVIPQLPSKILEIWRSLTNETRGLALDLKLLSFKNPAAIDYSLVEWSTQDKIIAIFLGYCFFATAGFVFLKLAHLVLGLKDDEKVEGTVADSLRQAGGVLKVIVIIGIEMIAFPLYCGFLLDMALLPLFQMASMQKRLDFIKTAPFTGLFIHWFIGTCYMFHFALFVSMCRKIMRKGVLYFIRDPEDPTFHPVRDVLERPVPNQLGKIAFSGLVYGGLVIMGLGGVVWLLDQVHGILPIHWATDEPRLALPLDAIFYNFLLPFIIKKAEPSKKIALIYEWWFRGCARRLRLTHFLFGEEIEEEKQSSTKRWYASSTSSTAGNLSFRDGTYVRAPASDSCRIPKGQKVFLEVNENNERIDGQTDQDKGLHGKNDERFAKIYIPPRFRARVAIFIMLLWLFAATTGAACTVGPLLVGRAIINILAKSQSPPNDLYAVTVGFHIFAMVAYTVAYRQHITTWFRNNTANIISNTRQMAPLLWSTTKYCAGILYLLTFVGFVLPFTLSLLSEMYIHVPIFTYLLSDSRLIAKMPTNEKKPSGFVFLLQAWTLGLLYLRIVLRLSLNYPARDGQAATAIRSVVRNGFFYPDIKLASRAIVLPASGICLILLATPLLYAKVVIVLLDIQDAETRMKLYRFAYPGLLAAGLLKVTILSFRRKLAHWRVKIRDEVYLIGERLHNFHETTPRTHRSKGKEKAL